MNHAIMNSSDGQLYAYEIDGFGGINFMDDAIVPSLMSLLYIRFLNETDLIYHSTKKAILSNKISIGSLTLHQPQWYQWPSS